MRSTPDSASAPMRRRLLGQLWYGMRARMFTALLTTALVTLAAAALALLAPLESKLESDSARIGEGTVTVDAAQLANLPVNRKGEPLEDRLDDVLENFVRSNSATYVVWDDDLRQIDDTDKLDTEPQDKVPPQVVRTAFDPRAGKTPHTLRSDVLVVTIGYGGRPYGGNPSGRRFVLEMIQRVTAVTVAGSVVRTAFLTAALVSLLLAILLGFALSSRLVRRLRLLRDSSRSMLERDPTDPPVPRDDVPDEIGEVARGLAMMSDRLRRQEEARRVFVSTASHELRTPLATMEGALELLEDDLAEGTIDLPDARRRVASARRQARRLSSLAKDLLDLSRIDAQLPLRNEPVELEETARAVAAEFEQSAREGDVAIELEHLRGPSWADADPGSVARVVRILLDNALRFAPPGTTVSIVVAATPEGPAIEVKDKGPGVPTDERELIFERFQRGRYSGEESGFGLGLAIGSELARRMGGVLELTDESPGATFRLRLRRSESEVSEPEPAAR
ncbi:MAG: HAMP domain-containing sensor histidine kinase [Solirubrobacteraceae bacterium]|jgi:signal transduction histidine kinase